MKRNKILLFAVLATISLNAGITKAADVTDWSGLNTTDNIEIQNDITATGSPKVIPLNSSSEQIINGNGHSITGASGYSITINNTADLTIKNLGSYILSTADDKTFSYTDMNEVTKYIKINNSVNSFPAYFLTNYKPITLNLDNSVFTNNTARLIIANKNQIVNIKNSVFYNNTTSTGDPIISGSGSTSLINIENSIFYNNSNTKDDGGVLTAWSKSRIKDSYFINNKAENDWDGFGGALNLQGGSDHTIEGSKFEGNSSYYDGGAIVMDTNTTVDYIKDSKFINNKNIGSDGGAISTTGGFIKTIDNVIFEGNKSYMGGGGLWGSMASKYNSSAPVLIKNTTFKNNEAGQGGGLYSEGSNRANITYIVDSKFIDNTVIKPGHAGKLYGGGIINTGGVPMTINNTDFEGNKAVIGGSATYSAGGGIYFKGGSEKFPLKIVDSTFKNNSAIEGGALFLDNADSAIIAASKDVVFSSNTAGADAGDYNGGADIYFQADSYSATLSLNAAEQNKIIFNGSVAAYEDNGNTATIDINKSGVTYNVYDGTTETPVSAGNTGEIQFNARVGDENYSFNGINLYGGTLSIGQNSTNNASTTNPDGYLNDNNFYVKGNSVLNTVNSVIGEFSPKIFDIGSGVTLDYKFDVDLANEKSDKISVTANNGNLKLSSFNVISDITADTLKVKYSDTNVGGIVKDDYTITTSSKTYDVSALNDSTGSYVVFSVAHEVGGLPAAINSKANQYIITNNQDENITAWVSPTGNVITADMDINGNGHSIFTDNNLSGIVVSDGLNVTIRNIENLSGFNDAITNDGGVLSIVDSNITNNQGTSDITNKSGSVIINAETKDIQIGSNNTLNALTSDGGNIDVKGSNKVTFNGNINGTNNPIMNIAADTDFNGSVSNMNIRSVKGNC